MFCGIVGVVYACMLLYLAIVMYTAQLCVKTKAETASQFHGSGCVLVLASLKPSAPLILLVYAHSHTADHAVASPSHVSFT